MSSAQFYTWGDVLLGMSDPNESDARKFYDDHWVDTWNLASPDSKTPDGAARGFSITRLVERTRERGAREWETVKTGDDEEVGVFRRTHDDGWASYLEDRYGSRDIFKVAHAFNYRDDEDNSHPVYEQAKQSLQEKIRSGGMEVSKDVGAEPISEVPHDVALSQTEKVIQKAAITETGGQGIGGATPIIIDPELFNTVRANAPILDVVPQVAQAGFTASFNAITARSSPIGMVGESAALDLTTNGETPQDFTITNSDTEMEVYVDLVDVSDFSQRATSSTGIMDLQATALEQRALEHAIFKAKQIYYGNPDAGESNGTVEDTDAFEGLREIAEGANGSFVKSKTNTDLSGDKALFRDIKAEIKALVKEKPVAANQLRVMTSPDVFNALENEANVNVRLDAFDGTVNFGDYALSISGAPVREDPNIRSYGDLAGTSTDGDVFIFDSRAVQFRALAPLSTMPLGRVGLGDRAALFEYGALIDRSQGEHTRVLTDYQVPSLPTV